jgi:hypothetical protein
MKQNPDSEFLLISIREAVDKLTKPYKQYIVQEVGEEEVEIIKSEVTLKALLYQLQEAIGSSQSVVSRGGSDMSTRSVLDAGALMLMTDIEEDLRELWNAVFVKTPKQRPLENAKAVRVMAVQINKLVLDNQIDDDELWKIKRIFEAWVDQIEMKFDPPVVIEVTRPCPHCHESFVFDDYNDRVLTLVVEWRKSFEESSAQCRACGYTWLGQTELRQMRWELDQNDEELDFSELDEE